jgi:hypothetical protein
MAPRNFALLALMLLVAPFAWAQQREGARAAATPVLETFDFAGVSLDGGPLRRQLDEVRDYYLRIPNDDLLRPFRARAGRPAPGAVLGGWYAADVFHVFGQILSGLARLRAATGDDACRDKVRALVHGFAGCVEDDGYFFASRKPNAPHYIFDKIVGGLVDAHRYCDDREALPLLARIVGWGEAHLARDRRAGDTSTEWYTLSENLYRAFLATGDARYREFAAVWEYGDWWQLLAAHGDPFAAPPKEGYQNGYHAYSHLNTIGGAARAYEVTGERRYLDTAIAAHDELWTKQAFATGGFGPDELLLPPAALRERLGLTHNSAETQCCAWAVFKLCKQLLRFTGEARFCDWIERQAYNAVAATIPATPDGRVFYYSDYCPLGATKVLHPEPWTCCSGTRPQAVAELVDLVWLRNGDDLFVNLFVPATVRFTARGTAVTVVQRTTFPASDVVDFAVTAAAPVAFALRVRQPQWLHEPITTTVNGERIAAKPDAHGWLAIERTWQTGDGVALRVPVPLWSAPLPGGAQYPAAILAGPVVLAVRTTGRSPHGAIDLARLAEVLEPSPGEELTFHVRGQPDLLLRPFHAVGADQPYFVYLDPALQNRVDHRDVAFRGGWHAGPRFHYSNAADAAAELAFDGTGIRWLGFAFDDAGIAEVTIDGNVVARVDQYGAGRDLPFDWRHTGLPKGRHVLRLRLTGERREASKDCYLNVAGFEIEPGQ